MLRSLGTWTPRKALRSATTIGYAQHLSENMRALSNAACRSKHACTRSDSPALGSSAASLPLVEGVAGLIRPALGNIMSRVPNTQSATRMATHQPSSGPGTHWDIYRNSLCMTQSCFEYHCSFFTSRIRCPSRPTSLELPLP